MNVLTEYVTTRVGGGDRDAGKRLEELGKFLRLIDESGLTLTPSQRVDEVWHALLEEPAIYKRFLTENGLRDVRHVPGAKDNDNYHVTRAYLSDRFGVLDETVWPTDQAGNCSGCSGDAGDSP